MSTKPQYYLNAEKLLDLQERKHTKKLDAYLKKYSGWNFSVASTPWCAAFVNATLGEAGIKGTGSFMARSFLKFGKEVKTPQLGDIVVFSRGKAPSGHVAYYTKNFDADHIVVLGGNQNDEVCMRVYGKNKILGYRRPL
jgi:uncharacterized protein (TIGR02594 family)